MAPNGRLTPAESTLAGAVSDAVESLDTTPADTATVRLALQYAETIDAADDRSEALSLLGPKLLAALTSLGASPAARASMTKGGVSGATTSRLEALRARRQG